MNRSVIPDSELVLRAKAGEINAFEMLVSRYEQPIYNLAQSVVHNFHEAQDVTQETFLSAIEHLESFREEASFYTWLSRIAFHAAFKILRKRKGLQTISLEAATEPQEGDDTIPHPEFIAQWHDQPLELLEQNETRQILEQALAELNEKYRLVFVLRDIEEFSVKETAQILNISQENVKVRLLRARLQLRERLTRIFGDEATKIVSSHIV